MDQVGLVLVRLYLGVGWLFFVQESESLVGSSTELCHFGSSKFEFQS